MAIVAGAGYLAVPAAADEMTSVTQDLGGAIQDLLQKIMGNGSQKIMGTTLDAADHQPLHRAKPAELAEPGDTPC